MQVQVHYYPFMIDPGTKPDGEEYAAYNRRRWGGDGWTGSMKRMGKREGAQYANWVTWPNTTHCSRLLLLAERQGLAEEVIGRLYRACYEEGKNVSLRETVAQVAVDVNCKDEDGDSPLHVCEDVETAKILLDAGADPGVPNGAGQVPYEVAAEEERSEVAQYLADAHPGYARAGLTRPNLAGVSPGPDCESMTVTIEELAKACGEDGTVDVQMAMDQAQDGKRRRV